jgi:hypothetical protein
MGSVSCAARVTVLTAFSAELQRVDEDHSVVRYKFAFQWCEGQGDPWWLQVVTQTPNGPLRGVEREASTTEEQHDSTLSRRS